MSLPKFALSLIPLDNRAWASISLNWSLHFLELKKLARRLENCDTHRGRRTLRRLKSQRLKFHPQQEHNGIPRPGGWVPETWIRLDGCGEPYSGLCASALNPRQRLPSVARGARPPWAVGAGPPQADTGSS